MAKALITFQDFKMSQSNKVLLDKVNVSIHQFDRIVLVGENGCGKSSLLNLLKNKEECDAGSIWTSPNLKIDYLEQDPPEPSIDNLLEFLSQNNQHPNLSKIKEIIEELNLKKINLKNKLSGGEIRKIYIAKLVLSESELLLLDEPTNHIDLPTIYWLEKKLLSLNKTLIIISHDQEFLSRISTKTFWIHQKKIFKREGPYNNFHNWTKEVIEIEKVKTHKLKQKIKSEKEWAVEGISARRKRNMGRLRDLEKLSKTYEKTKVTIKNPLDITLNKTNESALNIIETFDLSFSYNENDESKDIFSDLNLKIRRDDRIGIIGANGSGKSTLVKIFLGIHSPKTGRIKFGENVNIKYFDQNKFIPAIGQGIIGIECRKDDFELKNLLNSLHDKETAICLEAERAMNERLNGGCQVPIGGHAQLHDEMISIKGIVGSTQGEKIISADRFGSKDDATKLGCQLADELIKNGADVILESLYEKNK